MRCLLAALVMSLSISRGSLSLGSEKRSLSTDPTSRMLESLQQIFPLLRFFFPQSQKRTLSIITRQLTRNTKTNNGHPNKIEKSRAKAQPRRPHSLSVVTANQINGYETFTLDEHIRAKPDVIHYVEAPKINDEELEELKTASLPSEFDSEETKLHWHQDNENKFVVKRKTNPSDKISTTTTRVPLVKIVRYDPNIEEFSDKISNPENGQRVFKRKVKTETDSEISEEKKQETKFLPVQVGNKRFPLPDNVDGKQVKSVVLVLPQNYKLD